MMKEAKIVQIARSLQYLINNVDVWAVPYTELSNRTGITLH